MSVLQNMDSKFRVDSSEPLSDEDSIMYLINNSEIDVPNEYLEIIREHTEVEINVNNEKYVRIWGAEGCIEMNEAYNIQKYIPNSLAIGDDEGGNALLYFYKNNQIGLYMIAFNDLEVDELKYISKSLFELLQYSIGIDVILD